MALHASRRALSAPPQRGADGAAPGGCDRSV